MSRSLSKQDGKNNIIIDMILSIDGNKSIKKSFAQTKFELNLALANNGDSYSQLKIARSYYEGIGTKRNKIKAFEHLYAKADEKGNRLAKARLHYLNSLDKQKF